MEVAAWRESEAQKRDLPRGRVLKDDAIYEIAAQMPQSAEDLAGLRTVSAGLAKSPQGERLLGAIRRGLDRDPAEVPKFERQAPLPEGIGPLTDLLKVLLKMICDKEGVAQRVVATVDDLEKIAADDEADVAALKGWRRELFGDAALKLKRGELGLAAKNGKVVLFDPEKPRAKLAG
jgi:ribonuclease D